MRNNWIALFVSLGMLLTGCGDSGDGGKPSGGEQTPPATEQGSGSDVGKPDGNTDERPDETELPSLKELREEIAAEGALIGVASLGYAELPGFSDVAVYVEANGFGDAWPFLLDVTEDHAVLQEGGEVYAVVPVDKGVTLTVSEFIMDDKSDAPYRGKDLLTVNDGKPLLLRGNVSEIVPNLLITVQKGEKTLEYTPCLSGMDGSLVVDEGVYDFTLYELLPGGSSGFDPVPLPVFTLNHWYARHEDAEGNTLAMTLELNPDGTAAYSYGLPYSGEFERFSGTWTEETDGYEIGESRIVLQMTGGPVDDQGEPIPEEQYETTSEFSWAMQSYAIVLHHEDGNPLLYGTEDAWYTFLSFDGFHMVNHWTSFAEGRNWQYDLQLARNGECFFTISEVGGSELVGYEGWWYLEGEQLGLNLMLSRGEHPESPDLTYIYGAYQVETWEPNALTISHLSGEILTLEMEETRKTSFSGS